MKRWVIAVGYGCVAGAAAAVVIVVMNWLKHFLWQGNETAWRIAVVIVVGGAILGLLRRLTNDYEATLEQALRDARDPIDVRPRLVLVAAAMAVVSVAFGGAIGPEAAILAVITEMSALLTLLLARHGVDDKLVGEAGVAGALSGLYGSPPTGAIIGEGENETPRPVLFAAGLAGLLGFLLVASWLMEPGEFRVQLPDYVASGDGIDMLRAVLPAILGAVAGIAFGCLLPWLRGLFKRGGGLFVQTMIGTLAFAALASLWPILRFSGHHEMAQLLEWGRTAGVASLLALAGLKVLALALCIASGWRGGATFPLIFAGAAAGGAALWIAPSTPVTLALIAGIAAATTAGEARPIAAALIIVFLVSPFAAGPLLVGATIGYGASLIGPTRHVH